MEENKIMSAPIVDRNSVLEEAAIACAKVLTLDEYGDATTEACAIAIRSLKSAAPQQVDAVQAMPDYSLMRQAFTTAESGPDGYFLKFKFPTLPALQDAHRDWVTASPSPAVPTAPSTLAQQFADAQAVVDKLSPETRAAVQLAESAVPPVPKQCGACGANVGERCRTMSDDQCDAGKYVAPLAQPDEPTAREALIACLGDDAVTLLAANPDDGMAHTMQEAAAMLEADGAAQGAVSEDDQRDAAAYRALNTPEIADFVKGVEREALHQRGRWSAEYDAGKAPEDWFWLLGYLGGKALHAAKTGNNEKALHHTISSAAALLNWHAAILGAHTGMRPGIAQPIDTTAGE